MAESYNETHSSLAKDLIVCSFRPRPGVSTVKNGLILFIKLPQLSPKGYFTGNDFLSKGIEETCFQFPWKYLYIDFRDIAMHLDEWAGGHTISSSSEANQTLT